MVGLSQSFSHAVKALSCLHAGNCNTGFVRDIASCAGVPSAYLSKIFTRLAGAGILHAKRGQHGGNRLALPANKISLYDIAVALEGEHWIATCLLGDHFCSGNGTCPTHDFWLIERKRIADTLRQTTLADIIAVARTTTETCHDAPKTVVNTSPSNAQVLS